MADEEPPGDAIHTKGLWNRRRDLRCVRNHLGIEPDGDPDVEVFWYQHVLSGRLPRWILGKARLGPVPEVTAQRMMAVQRFHAKSGAAWLVVKPPGRSQKQGIPL